MKAAYIEQTGPPETIQIGEFTDPIALTGQVIVRNEAVAVNPIDTYVRGGMIAMELPKPFIVGCDFAGRVEAVGPGVKGLRIGDRVWGSNQGLLGRQGTFAELIAVDQQWVYHMPDGVQATDAAACALVGITAHLGLFREARLQAGETVFVRGGTGGVGAMVVQMAKAAGATVIATGGSDEKVQRCRELGADFALNYKSQDIASEVIRLAPQGVNVFWETMREPNFDFAIDLLAERGRMIVMAGRDARPVLPIGPFYSKSCRLLGFVMFQADAETQARAAAKVNELLAAGTLHTPIAKIAALDETAALHDLQHNSTVLGKHSIRGKLLVKF